MLLVASDLMAQQAGPEPLDGIKAVIHDSLLNEMEGSWKLTGKIMGRTVEHSVEAGWVLNRQFLRIHEKQLGAAAGDNVPYEAIVFVGFDHASDRYVVHWLDVFGGRFSETLGYGTRAGDTINLVFEYPEGPFHTSFRWDPKTNTWQWHMEQKDGAGKWTEFADVTLTPVAAGAH